jgi:hypothetical protein
LTVPAPGPSTISSSTPAASRWRLLVDASGIPLAVALTGGHRNDVTQLLPLLDDLRARPVAGKRGRPARGPTSSSPTAAMTTTNTAACSGSAASNP